MQNLKRFTSTVDIPFHNQDRTLIAAHRGFRDGNPQNTMLAYTAAARRGCDIFECDWQTTSDGEIVLYHDDTLDTLTDGTGTVDSYTLSQVQSFNITEMADTAIPNVHIPTARDFLAFARSINMPIFPEIKEVRTTDDIDTMLSLIYEYDMKDLTCISSFNQSDVDYVRSVDPDICVGLVGSSTSPAVYEPVIDQLVEYGNGVLIWRHNNVLAAPDIVTYAHDRGVAIAAWTVINIGLAYQLSQIGVDIIIADGPMRIR